MRVGTPLALVLVLGMSACAEFTPDGGMQAVATASQAQFGAVPGKITSAQDAERARAEVQDLLREPVSAEIAVRIALSNNRDLGVIGV
jgi:hypothetical protein